MGSPNPNDWSYEAAKLALAEHLAKEIRIALALCALLPMSFGLMTLCFGNTGDSVFFTITGLTLLFVSGGVATVTNRYLKGLRENLARARQLPSTSEV